MLNPAQLLLVRLHPDLSHRDAGLPEGQGATDVVPDQAVGGGVVGGEGEVVHGAAELRAHPALPDGGAQDDPDRFLDPLLAAGERDAPAGAQAERERPPRPGEVWRSPLGHFPTLRSGPSRRVPSTLDAVGSGGGGAPGKAGGRASLQVRAGSPARAAGFPLIRTVRLPMLTTPMLVGGMEKLPAEGVWGGVQVAPSAYGHRGLPADQDVGRAGEHQGPAEGERFGRGDSPPG